MIRKAALADVPECLRLARLFHTQSSWMHVPFDEQSARASLDGIINNPDGVIFLNGSGFIGAVLAPVLFNHAHRIAYEMFWFAERGGRELIRAYESWASENGAMPLMVCLEDKNVERISKIYQRRGYRPSERYFVKEAV